MTTRTKFAPGVREFLRSPNVPSEAFVRQARALLAAAEVLAAAVAEADARMAEHTRRGMVVWDETEGLRNSRRALARLERVSRGGR